MKGDKIKPRTSCCPRFERATGIEPVPKLWESFILPLNHARKLLLHKYMQFEICCQICVIRRENRWPGAEIGLPGTGVSVLI